MPIPTPALPFFDSVAEQIVCGKCLAGGCTVKLDGNYPKANLIIALWNGISRSLSWMAGSFIFCEAAAFRESGGFSKELFAGEEIDLSIRLKRLARKHRKRIVILRQHPLVTSARKLHLYTFREHFGFLIKASFFRNRTLSNRDACFTWYNGGQSVRDHQRLLAVLLFLQSRSHFVTIGSSIRLAFSRVCQMRCVALTKSSGFAYMIFVHKGLRVAVVERKPGRLDLHHDPMARQERMTDVRQSERIRQNLVRFDGLRVCRILAITAPQNVRREHLLVATELGMIRNFVGPDVYQFYDPVRITSGGGRRQRANGRRRLAALFQTVRFHKPARPDGKRRGADHPRAIRPRSNPVRIVPA